MSQFPEIISDNPPVIRDKKQPRSSKTILREYISPFYDPNDVAFKINKTGNMSEWIKVEDINKVRDYLPMNGETFLALWKGQFCLAFFDEDRDRFWLQMLPGLLSGDMEVSLEREGKFTHYMVLDYPKDY